MRLAYSDIVFSDPQLLDHDMVNTKDTMTVERAPSRPHPGQMAIFTEYPFSTTLTLEQQKYLKSYNTKNYLTLDNP